MTNTKGYRRGTRYMFSRDFRKKGTIPLSTYMKVYKRGDLVHIKVRCFSSYIYFSPSVNKSNLLLAPHLSDYHICIFTILVNKSWSFVEF